jgi:predicted dehydrogenase
MNPPSKLPPTDHDVSPSPAGRRGFLKQLSIGTVGMTLASAFSEQPVPAAETAVENTTARADRKQVRIGVVGGRFGATFQFHEHPDCTVAAVSDLRPERRKKLQEIYRCDQAYDSLEELVLDENIDAVAIFTDAPLHVDHVAKAMRNGKHVLSAVPAAFGTIDEAEKLLNIVNRAGLTYMMAETSYYLPTTISARKFYQGGQFGELFYSSAAYQHDGLEQLYFEAGKPTWRHGLAPMHYPTHTVAHLVGVTGERLTEVVCHGWGDDDPILKSNAYNNPFWNESATFKTDRGHAFDCRVWWKGAHQEGESAQWVGTKMSFSGGEGLGRSGTIVRRGNQTSKDDAGYVRNAAKVERYQPPQWWAADLLPKPLRHKSDHEGSHVFLTHEFIEAVVHNRPPAIDVYEALAYTVPGIVAHQSALRGGELLKIPQFNAPQRDGSENQPPRAKVG